MTGYREFRSGWTIVLCTTVGVALGLSPMPFYTIGVFAPDLAREFHWNQATIMGGLLIMTLTVIVVGPLTGWLADRFGVRRVTLGSVALFGLALMLFALQNGSLPFYYGTWAAAAALGSGTLPVTWTRAVNLWFDERKGLALGLTLTGTGLAGFLLKPYTAHAIALFHWRGAYVALGLLPLVISLPLALAFFRETPRQPAAAAPATRPASGVALRAAIRDWRFWLIGLAFVPISFAIGGPIPNMETLLATHGLRRDQILAIVPYIGLFVIVGRLAGGWLMDRMWAPLVAVVLLSIPSLSAALMARGPVTPATALLSIAGLGLSAGVEYDMLAFLTARYFGTLNYSAIYGALYGFFALGAGVGPIVYGRVYDVTGSFNSIVMIGGFAMAVGAAALLGLGRYRFAVHELTAAHPARPVGA